MNDAYIQKILRDVKLELLTIVEIATDDALDPTSKLTQITVHAYNVVLILDEICI